MNRINNRNLMLGVAAGVMVPFGVFAGSEEAAAPSGTEMHLPGMTILGSAGKVRELAGAGTALGVESLTRQSYGDVNQVLRQVPGVYLREEEGYGLFPNISIRGVDPGRSSKTTLLEDGVLTAPAPYSAPSAYYSPNAARMSGLEVLKGSSQIRLGPHSTGGAVNYLSTPIPSRPKGHLRTLYGSENEWRTHLYYGESLPIREGERFGYLVEGFYRRTDGFKRLDKTPDSSGGGTGFELFEPMIKLMWQPPTASYQRFEARVGYTDLDADETHLGLTEENFSRNPYRRYAASRFDRFSAEQFRSYLRHFLSVHPWESETTVYYNRFNRNWYRLSDIQNAGQTPDFAAPVRSEGMSSALAGGGFALGVLRGEEPGILNVRANNREFELWGIEQATHRTLELGRVAHRLSIGVRYHHDQALRFQWDDRYAQDATGSILARQDGVPGSQDDRLEQTDALALFVQDKADWGRFSLLGGVRYEYLEQRLDDRRAGRQKKLKDDLHLWSGSIGFAYALEEHAEFFGGLHRGVSPPQPQAALGSGVKEETSHAVELGTRFRNREWAFQGEVTGFFTAFDELMVRESVGVGVLGDENVGRAQRYGLEVALQADLGVVVGWSVRIPSFLSYTYTVAELTSDSPSMDASSIFSGARKGSRIPYIPEHTVSVGSGLGFERWSVNARCAYAERTYTTASNTREPVDSRGQPDARFGRTDSTFVVDLSADWKLSPGIQLFGGAQNLLDRESIVARHPHGPRPGAPLFLYAGMETSF